MVAVENLMVESVDNKVELAIERSRYQRFLRLFFCNRFSVNDCDDHSASSFFLINCIIVICCNEHS